MRLAGEAGKTNQGDDFLVLAKMPHRGVRNWNVVMHASNNQRMSVSKVKAVQEAVQTAWSRICVFFRSSTCGCFRRRQIAIDGPSPVYVGNMPGFRIVVALFPPENGAIVHFQAAAVARDRRFRLCKRAWTISASLRFLCNHPPVSIGHPSAACSFPSNNPFFSLTSSFLPLATRSEFVATVTDRQDTCRAQLLNAGACKPERKRPPGAYFQRGSDILCEEVPEEQTCSARDFVSDHITHFCTLTAHILELTAPSQSKLHLGKFTSSSEPEETRKSLLASYCCRQLLLNTIKHFPLVVTLKLRLFAWSSSVYCLHPLFSALLPVTPYSTRPRTLTITKSTIESGSCNHSGPASRTASYLVKRIVSVSVRDHVFLYLFPLQVAEAACLHTIRRRHTIRVRDQARHHHPLQARRWDRLRP